MCLVASKGHQFFKLIIVQQPTKTHPSRVKAAAATHNAIHPLLWERETGIQNYANLPPQNPLDSAKANDVRGSLDDGTSVRVNFSNK